MWTRHETSFAESILPPKIERGSAKVRGARFWKIGNAAALVCPIPVLLDAAGYTIAT
jgi:hypothetical protein